MITTQLTKLPTTPDDGPFKHVHTATLDDVSHEEVHGQHGVYLRVALPGAPWTWYQIGAPKPNRGPAQFVRAEWAGYDMQHRYEDLALIREVLSDWEPLMAVELGTAEGGFTALLADTIAEWSGSVLSVDHVACPRAVKLLEDFPNLSLMTADVLTETHAAIVKAISRFPVDDEQLGGMLLYCDNGNKMRELRLYAPHVAHGGLLGVHDWETEVWPDYANALLAHYGYIPYMHEEFAALASENYPTSLTRFWMRDEMRGDPGDLVWALPS